MERTESAHRGKAPTAFVLPSKGSGAVPSGTVDKGPGTLCAATSYK